MSDRPTALPVQPEGIPAYLRERPQWVVWAYTRRDNAWTKTPFDANSGRKARVNDPRTWADFNTALAAYKGRKMAGLGYVFMDGESGVDLDACRDAATGEVRPWAVEIVAALDSYAEVSPSATGAKAFLVGRKPDGPCRKKFESGEIEIYGKGRFFAVTGHHLDAAPATVNERGEQLTALCEKVFGDKTERSKGGASPRQGDGHPEDDEVLRRAAGAKNGAKFLALWGGSTAEYGGDDSRADAALCSMLAFWCRRDAAQVDRLFRRSGLMRGKWDERHGEKTYGQLTVAYAVEHCHEVYEPRAKGRRRAEQAHERNGQPPPAAGDRRQEGAEPARTGYDIIATYFRSYYDPAFRRNLALYSQSLNREVKMSEACCAPGLPLVQALKDATDVPRTNRGDVDSNALPRFFSLWAPSAWKDLLDSLPHEETAELIVDMAEQEFRDRVAAALLTHVTLGKHYDAGARDDEGTETQRRTLIGWCSVFAKPGKWADVRGYQCWCRREGPDAPVQVAIRKGLFGQLQGFTDLAKLSATKLTQLMERYQVGEGGAENRVKGPRSIVLTPDFLAYLLARPDENLTLSEVSSKVSEKVSQLSPSADNTSAEFDTLTPDSSRAPARENKCQSVKNDATVAHAGGYA
jgi:hypothetical protein